MGMFAVLQLNLFLMTPCQYIDTYIKYSSLNTDSCTCIMQSLCSSHVVLLLKRFDCSYGKIPCREADSSSLMSCAGIINIGVFFIFMILIKG